MVKITDTDPRAWTRYPPKCAEKRLERYQKYRNLLEGRHQQVFLRGGAKYPNRPEVALLNEAGKTPIDERDDTYVMSNYCKMATLIFANILFGAPPKFRVDEPGSPRQLRLEKMVTDNMLAIVNHQQEVEASHLGDAVYRIRWGRMHSWREDGVIIEAVPADAYHPILAPGEIKDSKGAALAFAFEYEEAQYLYKEVHEPYGIRYELWERSGASLEKTVPLSTVPAYAYLQELPGQLRNYRMDGDAVICETGYPGLFVEHVPNWTKPDRHFGISDYSPDIVANQGAVNAMQTGILRVCLKHMDPKLILPPGLLQYDENSGKWYIERADMEVIEVPVEIAAALPRYVTWDAQLGAAKTNIDTCFEAMMMSFGLSPAIFGWGNTGQADSAAALKLRMTQTLWIIGQKRMYFDAALKNILYAAQYLDGRYGPESYEPGEVSITWPDPLPADEAQRAQTLATMQQSRLIARETAVAQIQELEGESLDAEMDRIREDDRGRLLMDLVQLAASQSITPEEMLDAYRTGVLPETSDAPARRSRDAPFPEEE